MKLGPGVDISIKELVDKIKYLVGYQGSFIFNTAKPDGIMQKLTDISKLHHLGWRNSISLDKGLERLYSWYIAQ